MRGANSPWRKYNPNVHTVSAEIREARRKNRAEDGLIRMRRVRYGANDYKPALDTLIKRGRYKLGLKDNG